ncbi:MAG: 1-deoxy-D-xylulose-5-phosphate synthase, partial [Nitrospinota bacterium]
HKLLTGRREKFHTLRKEGGIAGFPRREESEYVPVNTGHSGTSISSALAFSKARDAKKEESSVIAVIGDGSMTSGLALEGLNNAGALNSDLLVVLNDNTMSISPNVGALSAHLNRIITGQLYNKMKSETEALIRTIPGIGEHMAKFAHRLEEGVKGMIIPGKLFEDLGFKYVGPIEGHSIPLLLDTLKSVKKLRGPILLHVVTKKGKGYKFAEEKPDNFHGTPQFNIENGNFNKKSSGVTYTGALRESLVKLAEKDSSVFAVTAAMADGTGLDLFSEKFPERFFDVGIAEQHAVTFAAGLAVEGFKPVVAIYSTFLQRAYDQLLHDVCLMSLPVLFVLDRAGIVGEDGSTHQGLFDISYLRHLPNMTVMSPKDENELGHMMYSALSSRAGPVAIRYPRGAGVGVTVDTEFKALPYGKGEVIRDGEDCAVFAFGNTVAPAVAAAEKLENFGIRTAVINLRFAKPLDTELLKKYVEKAKCIVTVEENVLQGGVGSAILEVAEELALSIPFIKRIGIPDTFVDHGSPDSLRRRYGLDSDGIEVAVKKLVERASVACPPGTNPE